MEHWEKNQYMQRFAKIIIIFIEIFCLILQDNLTKNIFINSNLKNLFLYFSSLSEPITM